MDGLRWLLLIVGLIVVVGVYLYGRRERDRDDSSAESPESGIKRREPSILVEEDSDEALESDLDDHVEAPSFDSESDDPPPAAEQKIVTLRIVAKRQGTFAGDELALSLRGIGMRHGKFGIFHRYEGNDESKIIFSAASLVEPGSFDLANLKAQEIPGISVFMVLPGPIDGAQAFDLLMAAARALTQSLSADLLDESGSSLSIQRERFLREEIIQYQTSNLVV
jgi:cell division protein ZipA